MVNDLLCCAALKPALEVAHGRTTFKQLLRKRKASTHGERIEGAKNIYPLAEIFVGKGGLGALESGTMVRYLRTPWLPTHNR